MDKSVLVLLIVLGFIVIISTIAGVVWVSYTRSPTDSFPFPSTTTTTTTTPAATTPSTTSASAAQQMIAPVEARLHRLEASTSRLQSVGNYNSQSMNLMESVPAYLTPAYINSSISVLSTPSASIKVLVGDLGCGKSSLRVGRIDIIGRSIVPNSKTHESIYEMYAVAELEFPNGTVVRSAFAHDLFTMQQLYLPIPTELRDFSIRVIQNRLDILAIVVYEYVL